MPSPSSPLNHCSLRISAPWIRVVRRPVQRQPDISCFETCYYVVVCFEIASNCCLLRLSDYILLSSCSLSLWRCCLWSVILEFGSSWHILYFYSRKCVIRGHWVQCNKSTKSGGRHQINSRVRQRSVNFLWIDDITERNLRTVRIGKKIT